MSAVALALLAAVALIAGGLVQAAPSHAATTFNVLFDDTSAETAGNADWIISTAMPDPLAQNPAPTTETGWTGALSAWGVALAAHRPVQPSRRCRRPGRITFCNSVEPRST